MYYPKSQISTNLYTKGNELQVQSTGENYIGYYYKTSTGAYYSGKNPSDKPTVTLVLNKNTKYFQSPQLEKDNNNKVLGNYPNLGKQPNPVVLYELDPNYSQVSSIDYESKFIQAPVNHKIFPTKKDYTRGQFQRYFLKKINNPIFKEQPKEVYEMYIKKDQYVQYDLYTPFNFVWTITGENKSKVGNINYSILELTEQRYNITGLVNYFKNKLTEYYKEVGS